jgi:hypothetical protein
MTDAQKKAMREAWKHIYGTDYTPTSMVCLYFAVGYGEGVSA